MKTPSWAVIIGIMLMLFGGCGTIKNFYATITPAIMDMQSKVMNHTMDRMKDIDKEKESNSDEDAEEIDNEDLVEFNEETGDTNTGYGYEDPDEMDTALIGSSTDAPPPYDSEESYKVMKKSMDDVFKFSAFNKRWTIVFGYIGMLVCGIYIMSGAFLVVRKKFAIPFVYFALALSIVFSLSQILVLSFDSGSGMMGKMGSYGGIFGLVIDIILLIVFASLKKTDLFTTTKEIPEEDWEKF